MGRNTSEIDGKEKKYEVKVYGLRYINSRLALQNLLI